MTEPTDGLDALKGKIAAQHLGDAELGRLLRGGNLAQLRESAARLRDEAIAAGSTTLGPDHPSIAAAVHAYKRDRVAMHERLFGTRTR